MSVRDRDMPLACGSRLDTVGASPNACDADSAWSVLYAWRATRLPVLRFGLLALLVGWAASVGPAFDGYGFAVRVVLAFALIAQFRLWDDLVDRERDRSLHPQRVLARSGNVRVFVAACVLLGALNLVGLLAWRGAAVSAGGGLLCLGAALWYRAHAARGSVHAHVLLLKYPAFVALLASPLSDPWTTVLAAAALYSALVSHELRDTLPAGAVRAVLLIVHGSVLALTACAPDFAVGGWIAAGAVVVVLAGAGLHRRALPALPGNAYRPFAAALVVLVHLTLGGNS